MYYIWSGAVNKWASARALKGVLAWLSQRISVTCRAYLPRVLVFGRIVRTGSVFVHAFSN